MRESHLDAIMEVEHESFTIPWSRKMLSDELANKSAYYLAAVADGKAVGYAGMWLVCDEGHITNIAVHPAYRRQGAGRMLLAALLAEGERRDLALLTLEVRKSNAPAISLYRSLGFEPVGVRKGYYADTQEDAVLMTHFRKRL